MTKSKLQRAQEQVQEIWGDAEVADSEGVPTVGGSVIWFTDGQWAVSDNGEEVKCWDICDAVTVAAQNAGLA